MMLRIRTPAARPDTSEANNSRSNTTMKWETPQAIDFRFGMEITMYIANR
jgi:coenzyme PQQ precursor peptide PqqA